MNLHIFDILIIILFFLGILVFGLKVKKKENSQNKQDFLLAGRTITLPFFVASLVATWYGNILGIGEFVYQSGIVAWVCFGVPYYISAYIFAKFFAKKINQNKFSTIPEQIEAKYGKQASHFASIVILLITLPAAYVLMLGSILQTFTGLSLTLSIIISTIISLAFLYYGGFKSDVMVNSVQFILMYAGFIILLVFAVIKLGSIEIMLNKLPSQHLSATGDKSIQYVIAWFIISLQTFVDPSFHQRCSAAVNSKTAKNGIYVSILFWMIFDFLTLFTGLYARAFFEIADPLQAYLVLAHNILPPIWLGIFIVGVLSVIISTLDSYAFISAITIGNDLLKKFHKNESSIIRFTQIGLIITAIFSVAIALLIPSAIDIIFKSSSVAIPGLLAPIVVSYLKNYTIPQKLIIPTIGIPSFIALIFLILQEIKIVEIAFITNTEPMLAGILTSLIVAIFAIKKI
jgi:SSS family solute:Na+ symporter